MTFKNEQLDPRSEHHLRRDPMVMAWIADYQSDRSGKHEDCRRCGWPHSPVTMCGLGSTFARVRLGGEFAYIDTSNVEYMRQFVLSLGAGAFHWRNQVYIARDGADVVISRIEYFNGSPSVKKWTIPVNEFASLVCAASLNGETAERYQQVVTFLT